MPGPRIPPVAWVVYCGALLALPVILWGFAHRTGDGAQHEIWYANFAAQLWQGEPYPHWLPEMNGGLGSPVFFFYPPLSFYITSLFHPLFGDDLYQWRALGGSAALGLVGSGLAAYVWLRQSWEAEIAAVVAVVYMALPYHLAVDLHYRGALPEFWAFVAMPLILHATLGTVKGSPRAIPLLAVSYASLLLTHPPTALIFSWIPPAYALIMAPRRMRFGTLLRPSAGMALGAGLAAIYLVPALTTQQYVSMAVMSAGKFDYANGFFFPHFTAQIARDDLERLLFWIAFATATIGLCTWPWRAGRREHSFWTAIVIVAVFMMLPVSAPVYEWVPLLPRIQFPWRFNALLAVAACALLPAVLQWLPGRLRAMTAWRAGGAWAIVVTTSAALSLWTLQSYNPIARKPEAPSWERKHLNLDAGEYRPHWAMQNPRAILTALGIENGRAAPAAVVEGDGRVTVQERAARRIVLEAQTSGAVIEVRQFYYPGWEGSFAPNEPLAVVPSTPAGLIRFSIPEGTHVITLSLRETGPERIGRWLSMISAAAVCWLALRSLRTARVRHGA